MQKAPLQFGMKALFAAITCGGLLLTVLATMRGNATSFGTFVGAMVLCVIAALATGLAVGAVIYLMGWLTAITFEPRKRQASPFQFRLAAAMQSGAAVVVAAFCMFAVLVID